ncbi:hypothetical protein MKZ08_08375 [Viridibacillus sp. FSL R5-0477]|uniref:Phage protein n=1 Tax=Viridibacillus arenosi FSL R5-213 TaxID=1227360 RepID=W4EUJ2_9BACL|nr:hypothetical protein [Viridibacillus arenosi]ETT84193.1 hypothetical protein C176_12533 [Viridibacillus arenosi FSL R5-213]OMC90013.1 hypothetical protein BK137_14795 [Viridibacillus arenosi]
MTISDEILANPILHELQNLLENQTAKGIAKYPNTVNVDDYSLVGWAKHAQEETLDKLVYLTCMKVKATEMEMKIDKLLSIARFYAHPQTYAWIDDKSRYIPSDIEDDKGNKARKVLEELGYESY